MQGRERYVKLSDLLKNVSPDIAREEFLRVDGLPSLTEMQQRMLHGAIKGFFNADHPPVQYARLDARLGKLNPLFMVQEGERASLFIHKDVHVDMDMRHFTRAISDVRDTFDRVRRQAGGYMIPANTAKQARAIRFVIRDLHQFHGVDWANAAENNITITPSMNVMVSATAASQFANICAREDIDLPGQQRTR